MKNIEKQLEIGRKYKRTHVEKENCGAHYIGEFNKNKDIFARFADPTTNGFDIMDIPKNELDVNLQENRINLGTFEVYCIHNDPKSPCYDPKLYSQIKEVIDGAKIK